jgi:tungstate transport system ATP-binding protein
MSIIAELREVTKSFADQEALNNVSLQVHEGEILGLLGPNGSGKTTLLKILAFIEKPTKGEVNFGGRQVKDSNAGQMRMESTLVFQKTVLFSTTVHNNVAYGLKIRGKPKKEVEELVRKTLKMVQLEGFEKRHAKRLSGGEQQRVALARALALNTRLLLLDEPTANLDPENVSIVEEAIAAANQELKTTIVMATHNMFQAKKLPHRIALMENGKIGEIGTPTEVLGKLSKTLASFAAVDNIFTGTAKTTEDGTTHVEIGSSVKLEMTGQYNGDVSVFISPEDIILSKSRFASSARNAFKGKIIEISDSGSLVRLRVDVGKLVTVQITKRSFTEMELGLNAEVFLAFKASSVQIV